MVKVSTKFRGTQYLEWALSAWLKRFFSFKRLLLIVRRLPRNFLDTLTSQADHRLLPPVLGRDGLHGGGGGQQDVPGPQDPQHRRRRGRGHARHHLQTHRHVAVQAKIAITNHKKITRLFILCNYLWNTTEWNMDYTKLSPGCSISSVECLTSWFILRATIPAGSCDQAFLEDFLVFFHLLTKNFILLIEMMACTATLQTITYSYVSSKFKKENTLANPSHKPKDWKSDIFGISFFAT